MRSKIYHSLINMKHWFEYARIIVGPLLFASTIMSQIGIFIIYLGYERKLSTLIIVTTTISIVMLISGYFLFIKSFQPTDYVMSLWRNTLPCFLNCIMWQGYTELFKRDNLPIPQYMKDWGFNSWDQTDKIIEYILNKGKQAKAFKIVEKFLEK